MDTQLSQALILPRAAAFLFGFAGLMGLLISTVGIYGVVSFGVAQQTREIGIRMALGARREQVLGMGLKRGLILTITGCATGVGLALALSRIAASLLYGVSPTDMLTFTLVPLLLLVIALAACLVPAQRASSLDPIRALRYDQVSAPVQGPQVRFTISSRHWAIMIGAAGRLACCTRGQFDWWNGWRFPLVGINGLELVLGIEPGTRRLRDAPSAQNSQNS
jgi:predicted lysophospholipase L1 biosynthesis ABC-type transport system permease subunit